MKCSEWEIERGIEHAVSTLCHGLPPLRLNLDFAHTHIQILAAHRKKTLSYCSRSWVRQRTGTTPPMTTWLPPVWVAVGHMGKILHRRRTDVAWTLLNEFPCHGVVIQRDNSMTVPHSLCLLMRPSWTGPYDLLTHRHTVSRNRHGKIVITLFDWWVTFKDGCLWDDVSSNRFFFYYGNTLITTQEETFKIRMKQHLECISHVYHTEKKKL